MDSRTYFLAPLAGYTDVPFREVCRKYGCLYAYTPLIDAGALIHGNPHNDTILARGAEESWLATQVLSGIPEVLREAGRKLRDYGFEEVDLNMGCPVPKVTRRGAGAALGEDVGRAAACAEALAEGYGEAITAKIRILSEDDVEATLELAQALAGAGVKRLAIHGRTWQRKYSGPVWAGQIRVVARELGIPVVANGGIFTAADADALAADAGTESLMIARGAIGNPWIFRALNGTGNAFPEHDELCEDMQRHIEGMIELYGENIALRSGRKIILAYLVGRGYRRTLRAQVTGVSTRKEFLELMTAVREEGPTEGFLRQVRKCEL